MELKFKRADPVRASGSFVGLELMEAEVGGKCDGGCIAGNVVAVDGSMGGACPKCSRLRQRAKLINGARLPAEAILHADEYRGTAQLAVEVTGPRGVLYAGDVGCGKTWRMLAKARCDIIAARQVRWLSWPHAMATCKDRFADKSGPVAMIIAWAKVAPVLYIDDLGKGARGQWVQEFAYLLFDWRAASRLPTSATSNHGEADLTDIIGDAAFSRMMATTDPVTMAGPDRRRA